MSTSEEPETHPVQAITRDHPINCRNCELDGDPSFCGADPGNREPYACDMCDRYELDLADLRAKLAAVREVVKGELCDCPCCCCEDERCLACRIKEMLGDK